MPVKLKRKLNLKKIKELHQREKNYKVKAKYQALILLEELGGNTAEIGRRIGKDRTTIGRWIKRYNKEGLKGLNYQKPSGRPPRLTKKDQEKLKKILLDKVPTDIGWEYPVWDGKSLSYLIKKLFGLEIKIRRCQYLFHEMGFSLQRGRHIFPQANTEEQKKFKRSFKKKSKIWTMKKK